MVFVVDLEPWESKAAGLAMRTHGKQLDKGGKPYYEHPWRVAQKVRAAGGSDDQIAAAHLHDIVEDTELSLVDVATACGMVVAELVDTLTHRKGETNMHYWERIKADPYARLVKLCDIYDNLDPQRMARLDEKTQARLISKYGVALGVLYD